MLCVAVKRDNTCNANCTALSMSFSAGNGGYCHQCYRSHFVPDFLIEISKPNLSGYNVLLYLTVGPLVKIEGYESKYFLGGSLSLQCNIVHAGYPEVTAVTWFKNGQRYTRARGSTLT